MLNPKKRIVKKKNPVRVVAYWNAFSRHGYFLFPSGILHGISFPRKMFPHFRGTPLLLFISSEECESFISNSYFVHFVHFLHLYNFFVLSVCSGSEAIHPEKQEKYLRTIRSKAEDMTRMIEELSLYTRIDCKSYPYHFEKVRLKEFFSDCIEEDEPELERKGIRMSLENYLSEDDEVYADREQLKRITMNIIGNAVKYLSKESGTITISLYDEFSYIRTEIRDTGAGIPKKDLPHIFERFYRGDTSRNTGKGGSGLGLAIAKQIVEDHGGTIGARSEEGEGTTISFTLLKVRRDGLEQHLPRAYRGLDGVKA